MRVSADRFEKMVFDLAEEVLQALPPHLRAEAENVILHIEQQPSAEQRRNLDLEPGSTLYGLYEGVPLIARHADSVVLFPDRITLFQGPLQAAARTEAELRAQVRRTLIHELAHFFGRSDEELLARGKY